MKTNLPVCLLLSVAIGLQAQTTQVPVQFSTKNENGAVRFTADCPPLPPPIPGAPEPFYTYYWEFGDGDFSLEKAPAHQYATAGTYTAGLDVTAHYDDTDKPPSSFRSIMADAGGNGGSPIKDVFSEKRQTVAMKTNRNPRPKEELICIISYRNNSAYVTDGRLHLFFNEKKFPAEHFKFKEGRTHFNEVSEASYSAADIPKVFDWSALSAGFASSGDAAGPFIFAPPTPRTELMLSRAREAYRDEQSWRFTQLRPGETRNVFVTLGSTAAMLKDTSAFIHLQGILAPFDPAIDAGEFVLEIEIVSSHDPNAIAVSDSRVNFRRLGSKKLDYKVQFQNNGEGPAKKVELTITVPEGLNTTQMRPLSWYPKCTICPKNAPTNTLPCLDTVTMANALVFTFRNIYLPGSRQEGVSDYDSTQGFVRYRLEPFKNMPKRSFNSQAKIVFDKNKPIYTNFSKTRFKMGLSPGPKVGYAFLPDSFASGYLFLGLSLSPYKSWKFYPQIELLTGLKGQTDLPETITYDSTGIRMVPDPNGSFLYTDTITTTGYSGKSGFFSIEIPVLLRKNFTKFLGMGIGASAQLFFVNGTGIKKRTRRVDYYESDGMGKYFFIEGKNLANSASQSRFPTNHTRFTVFADLTLGAVRAGPNLGIRVGGRLHDGFQPFVQASLEVKL